MQTGPNNYELSSKQLIFQSLTYILFVCADFATTVTYFKHPKTVPFFIVYLFGGVMSCTSDITLTVTLYKIAKLQLDF
jgi:hypothetical protein